MLLESLQLHNFRNFSDLEVKFHDRLTVFVGNNGAGKSTVLEAATIAAGTLVSSLDSSNSFNIKRKDAKNQYYKLGSNIDIQQQFPVEISARGNLDGKDIKWSRVLKSSNGRCTVSTAKELTNITENYGKRIGKGDSTLMLPVVAYYGTGRLWAPHRERHNDLFGKNNRLNGYKDSLDGAANNKLMINWFQKMTMQQIQRGTNFPEYIAVKGAIEQIVRRITGYDVEVQFNLDINDIDIIYDSDEGPVRIPLSLLSDGYKCTISLIADIAYRMAVLNPQLYDSVIKETDGVVIIDEVDLHLHPKWQKQILNDLMEIFPKVQFIVSTHAPEVISSVQNNSIVLLKGREESAYILDGTYGKDANTILKEVMKSPTRPDGIKSKFNEFYKYLDNGDFDKAETVINELENKLGTNDSDLNACIMELKLERI